MSEKILRALMQLFAIVANTDEVGLSGREIVERFLRRQLSSNLVTQYLLVYDEFLEALKGKSEEGKVKKRTSVNSVKVLKIGSDINKELEQKQKVIVLIRLLEFVHTATNNLTEQHHEFLKTIAETFGIANNDYENCYKLVSNLPNSIDFDDRQFLIIDKNNAANSSNRHIYRDNLSGKLVFLYISNPQFFVFTYHGADQLFLDGRAVIPGSVHVFEPGSVIRGAKLNGVYYNELIHNYLELSVTQNITFKIEGLGYSFNKSKIGLHDLNFTTTSKNLIAVMGNSGAGKTTLLNLLNGSTLPTKGQILINNVSLHQNSNLLHGLIGNIPQDDLLIEELSVFQNLFYSTKLYFGRLTEAEITQKVDNCLRSLGLYEIKDLPVGDPLNKYISGGQRKRLNIALELIREPEILFVDEPTSGLSSNDAENVMDLLKQLTLSGKLIFVVIHQPSSEIFKLFDQLLILDKGGYPVYFGNPVDSVRYFKKQMNYVDYENSECAECGNINPEEIFKIIEAKTVDEFGRATKHRKVAPDEWFKLYNTHFVPTDTLQEEPSNAAANTNKVSNPLVQFGVYLQRNLFAKINNRQYMYITLLEGPILALILSIALRSTDGDKVYSFGTNINIPVYLFICTIVSLFLGLIVSADEIIQDKKILKRESFLRLNRSSYLLSKIAFLFLVSAVQTLLFLLIGNFILGFNGLFLHYWIVLFSVSCFANLLGLNISSGMKTRIAVYILIPFLVIPQIMLSGVMVHFEDLGPLMRSRSNVPVVGNIMASRWAYEALAVDQFKNNDYEAQFFDVDAKLKNSKYRKDFWMEQMKNQAAIAENLTHEAHPSADSIAQYDAFFKSEFRSFKEEYPAINIVNIASLSLAANAPTFLQAINTNLDNIATTMIAIHNNAMADKNKLTEKLNKDLGGNEQALIYKNKYHNEPLEKQVCNDLAKDQTLFSDNAIIRKYHPVFYKSLSASAPFYAHTKTCFGMQIETLWFNIVFIWLMTGVLYITLYFDVLRRVLEKK